MSVDLDVDAAFGPSIVDFDPFEEKEKFQVSHLHNSIFVPPGYLISLSNKTALNHQTHESQKSHTIVLTRLNSNKTAITEGNEAGGSASADSNGNSKVDVYVKHTETDEKGNTSSWGGSGSANTDSQGNTTYEGTVFYKRTF